MNLEIGFYHLWLILAILGIFGWLLIKIGDKLRGTNIENIEDHNNPKVAIISHIPMLLLLIISIFTPIEIGHLFWIGCILIIIAGIIHILSVMAFIKSKKGLITKGIYRFSRNPMYLALFLTFVAFTLMAFQANESIGILTACISLIMGAVIHWMVLNEEKFLIKKYGDAYNEYKESTARYIKMRTCSCH